MKPLFVRNLGNTGRLVRGLGALALFVGAGIGFFVSIWLGVGLGVCGCRNPATRRYPSLP